LAFLHTFIKATVLASKPPYVCGHYQLVLTFLLTFGIVKSVISTFVVNFRVVARKGVNV